MSHTDQDVAHFIDGASKDDKSMLVYAETCVVDHGGLLEGQRMNEADLKAMLKFEREGLAKSGRIPARLLGQFPGQRKPTHWIKFTDFGWEVAHALRRERGADDHRGPYARAVFDALELDGKL